MVGGKLTDLDNRVSGSSVINELEAVCTAIKCYGFSARVFFSLKHIQILTFDTRLPWYGENYFVNIIVFVRRLTKKNISVYRLKIINELCGVLYSDALAFSN